MKTREVNWYIDTKNGVITEGFIDNIKTFGEKMYGRMMKREQPSWTYKKQFYNRSNASPLKDMNLTSLNYNFYNLEKGGKLFYNIETLKDVHSSFPKLIYGQSMFRKCYNLEKFEAELPKLENGSFMFSDCHSLKEFEVELPKLEKAVQMFNNCEGLVKFNANLANLKNANRMFYSCQNLTDFNAQSLDALVDGECMFDWCPELESFDYSTPKLKHSSGMFQSCHNLRYFNGDLSELEDAYYMFLGCKLDTESVINIAESIKEWPQPVSGDESEHQIWISVDVFDSEVKKYIKIIERKGWDISLTALSGPGELRYYTDRG